MKIAAATVAMRAQHLAVQRQETRESLRTWREPVRISDAGRAKDAARSQAADAADPADDDPRMLLIRRMLEMLTGRPVKVYRAEAAPAAPQAAAPEQGRAGYGIEYDYHAVREEAEATRYSAQGVIRTADGKEIAFTLNLDMSRHYRDEVSVSFRAGDAVRKDPLVLNFDGSAAQLTDQRFLFDLDADGNQEQVATLASGSAYLALDRNANGAIDSGAELFGPATGSGFAELAAYDADDNGWIDESDAVYSRLRLWTPAADGSGALETLAAREIGALFLGRIATPFELRGNGNSELGAVAATGLYLREDGQAETLQEIDLSV
ncbi:MAG: hypothetical protein HZC22_01510 [Rhodocyclales bacterium]|nr:hypothetical protein [Rhodocyclales bacterium]